VRKRSSLLAGVRSLGIQNCCSLLPVLPDCFFAGMHSRLAACGTMWASRQIMRANFITAVVDGFLFQHFEERVTDNCTPEERFQKLERFLDRALGGLLSC